MTTNTVESLYAEHAGFLRAYGNELMPGHGEDVLQETFIRVIQYLDSGKPINRPRAFLATTARNFCISLYRRHIEVKTDCADMDEYTVSDRLSPERCARREQKLRVAREAVAALPDRYR